MSIQLRQRSLRNCQIDPGRSSADLFELKGQPFLLVTDYFSSYIEVAKLSHTTSPDIAVQLKSMFARHGIPDQLISDNGPQFSANTFTKFTEEYRFAHIKTSPRFPQVNSEVERAVQTVKQLLKSNRPVHGPDGISRDSPGKWNQPCGTSDG